MANFLRLSSMRFPVLLKTFVRPKVSLPRLKPLKFDVLGERHGCAQVVRRDARYLSSTSDANNGANKSSCDEVTKKGCGGNEKKPNGVMYNENQCNCKGIDEIRRQIKYLNSSIDENRRQIKYLNIDLGSHNQYHRVDTNTDYHVFSLMSRQNDALLRVTDRETNRKIDFKGSYDEEGSSAAALLEVRSEVTGPGNSLMYKLYIKDGSTEYILGWKDNFPELFPMPAGDKRMFFFEPIYGWSFTMFKRIEAMDEKPKYLACHPQGKAMFVEMEDFAYPNAQALFVIHEASTEEEGDSNGE